MGVFFYGWLDVDYSLVTFNQISNFIRVGLLSFQEKYNFASICLFDGSLFPQRYL